MQALRGDGEETGKVIATASLGNVKVHASGNSLFIDGAAVGTKFFVADLNGRVLKASEITSVNQEIRISARGVLFVNVGGKVHKIAK